MGYPKEQLVDKSKRSRFAFAECSKGHHIVGFVDDDKYYFSDISELKLMFPLGQYEEWRQDFW